MTSADINARDAALFLVAAMAIAGVGQAIWLGSAISRRFAWPLDGGATWRGRRLFGDNKTARGFIVMVPATGAAFALMGGLLASSNGGPLAVWPLTTSEYFLLGLWAGIGFMVGELPNSCLKRQLAVPPGQAAPGRVSRWAFALLDRIDSAVGMMIALALVVPMSAAAWLYMLTIGPVVHGLFSLLVFQLGGKTRPA